MITDKAKPGIYVVSRNVFQNSIGNKLLPNSISRHSFTFLVPTEEGKDRFKDRLITLSNGTQGFTVGGYNRKRLEGSGRILIPFYNESKDRQALDIAVSGLSDNIESNPAVKYVGKTDDDDIATIQKSFDNLRSYGELFNYKLIANKDKIGYNCNNITNSLMKRIGKDPKTIFKDLEWTEIGAGVSMPDNYFSEQSLNSSSL